jgi:hypothetical protein
MHLHLRPVFVTFMYIQGDLRENVNIFKVDSFGHCEKISYEHVTKSEWLPS